MYKLKIEGEDIPNLLDSVVVLNQPKEIEVDTWDENVIVLTPCGDIKAVNIWIDLKDDLEVTVREIGFKDITPLNWVLIGSDPVGEPKGVSLIEFVESMIQNIELMDEFNIGGMDD